MRKRMGLLAGVVAVAAAVALARCGSSERMIPPPDAGTGGSGGPAEAGGGDGGTQDAGGSDGGAPDGGGTDGGTAIAPPVLSTPAQADVQRFPGPTLVGASLDEGGNLWGVSNDALWLWRSGGKGWEKFDNHKSGGVLGNGHANDGLLSVAGGAPGEAWIGYRGLFLNGDEEDDPAIVSEAIRTSGGADRVSAVPGGVALRDHLVFWTGPGILAAEPKGRWKVRSIWTILYNHGPLGIPGDVVHVGVDDPNQVGRGVGLALAREQLGPLLDRQLLPSLPSWTHSDRPVGLGQAVDVHDPEVELGHSSQQRG